MKLEKSLRKVLIVYVAFCLPFLSFIFINFREKKETKLSTSNNIPNPTPTTESQNEPLLHKLVSGASASNDYTFKELDKDSNLGAYIPDDLSTLPSEYSIRNIQVSAKIIFDLTNLISKAREEGIDLSVVSGYRSVQDQKILFEDYVWNEMNNNPSLSRVEAEKIVNNYSAKPGSSEHQLGMAVDVLSSETNYEFSSEENLAYVKWLENNVEQFNFRITYKKGNPDYQYEPWHIRWWPKN